MPMKMHLTATFPDPTLVAFAQYILENAVYKIRRILGRTFEFLGPFKTKRYISRMFLKD